MNEMSPSYNPVQSQPVQGSHTAIDHFRTECVTKCGQ